MFILAFDPGTTTGVAAYDTETDTWSRNQLGPLGHHDQLWHLLEAVKNQLDVVVCESFTYQMRQKVVLDSVEYIGVLRLWCCLNEKNFLLQTPTMGKGFWTDDKVKTLGLWLPNQPHAMDATRHALYFLMTKGGHSEVLDRLKGDRGGA